MLRKLIAFALTAGLAKKGWDMYQEKNATATGAADAGAEAAEAKPAARKPAAAGKRKASRAKKDKPSA